MTDRFTVRAVVIVLGVIALFGLVGITWLAAEDKTVPSELVAITSAAAGALSALLARTTISDGGDQFGGGAG